MAKDKEYEYPYSDEKGRYRYARHKGGNPYRIYEGSKKHIVGGKAIWVRKDQNLADAMLESGQYSKDGKMREGYRRAKKRDENEEKRLYQEAKEKDKEEGYDISHQDKYIDKAIENVDRYSNYTNTKKELEREQYDRENEDFEKGLEKYDDESNKDFLRRGKVKNDYDEGKIGDREYNRRMGELDRKKIERERAEEGPLREKEREKRNKKELEEAFNKQDDEDDDYGDDDFKTPPSLRKKDKTPQDTKGDNWKAMEGFGNYQLDNEDGTQSFIKSAKDVNGNTKFVRTDVDKQGYKVQNTYDTLEQAKTNKLTNDYKVSNGNPVEDLISKKGINVGGRLREVDDEAKELFKTINDKNLNDEQAKFMLHSKYYDSNEDSLLDKYKEWQKQNKSTNETMNNAIREKANDKPKKLQGYRINEEGKRELYEHELSDDERGYWTKENGQRVYKENPRYKYDKYSADEQDILDGFGEDYGWDNPDKLQNLKEQIDYMRNPTESIRQTAKRYATGGSGTMLIYTGDAEDYLKERNIKYDKNDPFETYANVMAEKIEKLYNDANKSKYDKKYNSMDEVIADKDSALNQYIRNKANEKKAFRQYKKDHPNSDMTLKQFREMNK